MLNSFFASLGFIDEIWKNGIDDSGAIAVGLGISKC